MFTCAVYPVYVDVDGGPPEHEHDALGVLLLDLVLKDDLVGEPDPPLARIVPRKHARSSTHFGTLGRDEKITEIFCQKRAHICKFCRYKNPLRFFSGQLFYEPVQMRIWPLRTFASVIQGEKKPPSICRGLPKVTIVCVALSSAQFIYTFLREFFL